MYIKRIVSQNRRDFVAEYKCEHCEHEEESTGYDDEYFHSNVIPKMGCKKCGKSSNGVPYDKRNTKYPEGYQV